jgi:N-sulfoglucosamine sulfohydrolase
MIVSEDNGPELGCYGDPYARTPHLDKLAASGVRFNRAFVTQAGCSQSRASILTGLYPHQHGQIGLATWGFRMYRPDTPNLVRGLKEAGYRTGIIGKLHAAYQSGRGLSF